jgi:hypothetical protein
VIARRRGDLTGDVITNTGVERIDESQQPIAQMRFHLSEIANVALEVMEYPSRADP